MAGNRPLSELISRDPACDFTSYHEPGTSVYGCPVANKLDSEETCKGSIPRESDKDRGCFAYFQVRVEFGLGREVPFTNGVCDAHQECKLDDGETHTQSRSWSFNVGLEVGVDGDGPAKAAFSAGSSVSWTESLAYTTAKSLTKPDNYNGCGQWTFIPYSVTSCGSLSAAPVKTSGTGTSCGMGVGCTGLSTPQCDKDKAQTTKNWCTTTGVTLDGKNVGAIKFIRINCTTQQPLQDGQPAVYYWKGVSKHPGFKSTWPPPPSAQG
ncbi:uncharacterized protein JN550_002645 [Neoarthrinium moseri]|uniref:uncharacterized protein n=1 Tax=Neoarthrinium moseri TaxID=1658444 RepID=UPI001FDD7653|nr:uncharacterized protein JN550_002645 [Neoarthrinium moseri]KAI1874066.1 hypothetical protein JN550_002645 [Neoarthrinium moseri]